MAVSFRSYIPSLHKIRRVIGLPSLISLQMALLPYKLSSLFLACFAFRSALSRFQAIQKLPSKQKVLDMTHIKVFFRGQFCFLIELLIIDYYCGLRKSPRFCSYLIFIKGKFKRVEILTLTLVNRTKTILSFPKWVTRGTMLRWLPFILKFLKHVARCQKENADKSSGKPYNDDGLYETKVIVEALRFGKDLLKYLTQTTKVIQHVGPLQSKLIQQHKRIATYPLNNGGIRAKHPIFISLWRLKQIW